MEVVDRKAIESYRDPARESIASEEGALVLVNKPYGETSFYVVNKIRQALSSVTGIKRVKVGHAGTLDPLADGLLIIATRRKTKTLGTLTNLEKTYLATIRFGISSPSFDLERPITIEDAAFIIDEQTLASVVRSLIGTQMQVPPIYSAVKQDGRPVYHLARRGEQPELKPREIEIYDAELVSMSSPYATIRIRCSKGTYIRSLVRDIALAMGAIGVLTALRRESVGSWRSDEALTLDEADRLIRNSVCRESEVGLSGV